MVGNAMQIPSALKLASLWSVPNTQKAEPSDGYGSISVYQTLHTIRPFIFSQARKLPEGREHTLDLRQTLGRVDVNE